MAKKNPNVDAQVTAAKSAATVFVNATNPAEVKAAAQTLKDKLDAIVWDD